MTAPAAKLSSSRTRRLEAGLLAAFTLLLAACGPATSAPASPGAQAGSSAGKTASSPAPSSAAGKPAASAASGADVDALYEAAKKEGEVVFYGSLNSEAAEPLLKVFEKRFPGIKVTGVRASSEKLVQRFATEVKAGKVLADVLECNAEDWLPVLQDGLIAPYRPPEAAALPEEFRSKDDLWFAARTNQIVIQCNTDKVPAQECLKLTWESLTEPKWKDQLLIEQGDTVLVQTWAKQKYQNDDKAAQLLKGIAANNAQPQSGHTETSELLVGGKRAVFVNAYLHRVFQLQEKKAATDWARTEAVLLPSLMGQVKGAAHPNAGKLLENWMLSKEGAEASAAQDRPPARRDVPMKYDYYPKETKFYSVQPQDVTDKNKYQKIWDETLGLR